MQRRPFMDSALPNPSAPPQQSKKNRGQSNSFDGRLDEIDGENRIPSSRDQETTKARLADFPIPRTLLVLERWSSR